MDALLLTAAIAGCAVGFVASAVPGLHVNAVAAIFLGLAGTAGPAGVVFLVAAFAASPFGLALPATFLGGSSEEDALSSLPAHRLMREGRGLEAVALQAWGAFLGIAVALAAAPLARPALTWAAPLLPGALPFLLVAIVLLLLLTDPARPAVHRRWLVLPWGVPGARRLAGALHRDAAEVRVGAVPVRDPNGWLADIDEGAHVEVPVERIRTRGTLSRAAGVALATLVFALAGALGLAALPLGSRSPLGLPTSPLLPLLAGIFAAPTLLAAITTRDATRARHSRAHVRARMGELLRAAWPGALASSLLGLVPGVSGSHAALLVPRGRTPERALVTLSALNGGAVVFTLLAWHALGKARAGALVAAQALAPVPTWNTPIPPDALFSEASLVLAAASAACLLTRGAGVGAAAIARRVEARALAGTSLTVLMLLVLAFNGLLGLSEFVTAASIGVLLIRWRHRRGLGMGVILVPALFRALGWS